MEARSKASLDERVRKGENEEGGVQRLTEADNSQAGFFLCVCVRALCLDFSLPWSHKMSQPGSIFLYRIGIVETKYRRKGWGK